MKLTVAYRVCPLQLKPVPLYGGDKFQLMKTCLETLLRSLKGVDYRFLAIVDSCPAAYSKLLTQLVPSHCLELFEETGLGNVGSFGRQMELLLSQNYSDVVYLAEDDYFYLRPAFREMLKLLEHSGVDFISPYDHPDYLELPLHREPTQYRQVGRRRWRSSMASTCTFLTQKSTLHSVASVFRHYGRVGDLGIFLPLTRSLGETVQAAFRVRHIDEPPLGRLIRRTVRLNWRTYWGGRRLALWTPTPTLATHMEARFLSRGVDWERVFRAAPGQRSTPPGVGELPRSEIGSPQ